jgi:haloalkane dehalogenase
MSRPDARRGIPVLAEHLRRSRRWLHETEKGLERLAHLQVRLVWGMRDPIFGRRAYLAKWMQLFPHAGLDRVFGASHYLPEDAPERMARSIRAVVAEEEDSA